jgi:hypothetical protein
MKQSRVRGDVGSLSQKAERDRLLQARPVALGAAWALESCEDAKQSGRRIEGGWPGTVPEARMRVVYVLDGELAALGMSPLSPIELAAATSAAYERAKHEWHLAARAKAMGSRATSTHGITNES